MEFQAPPLQPSGEWTSQWQGCVCVSASLLLFHLSNQYMHFLNVLESLRSLRFLLILPLEDHLGRGRCQESLDWCETCAARVHDLKDTCTLVHSLSVSGLHRGANGHEKAEPQLSAEFLWRPGVDSHFLSLPWAPAGHIIPLSSKLIIKHVTCQALLLGMSVKAPACITLPSQCQGFQAQLCFLLQRPANTHPVAGDGSGGWGPCLRLGHLD